MGLFSFVGKAIGGVAKAVGGVVKTGFKAAQLASSIGILPGPAGKVLGLLSHKQSMSTTANKIATIARAGISGIRAQPPTRAAPRIQSVAGRVHPAVLRATPIMPGGAVATPRGVVPPMGTPPLSFGGGGGGGVKRKRRKRGSAKRRRSSSSSRGRKRRLKFGSPAWRKKYLGHGRKRRKRAA